MKVLVINKFYRPGGGSERYMFDAIRDLERHGHTVIPFTMQEEDTLPSPYSPYFVSGISYRNHSIMYKLANIPRIVGKTVYSFETRRKLEALLRDTRPDIAHVHMVFHQLSPSVFHSLRKFRVPTVQTLHNYKLVCPATDLYISHKSELCERCLGGQYYQCARHRCIKGSRFASYLAAAAQYFHKAIGIYERNVDRFLVSTHFFRDKLIEGGMPAEKLHLMPLTLDIEQYEPQYEPGDYFLCYGRMVRQKGIHTLIEAAAKRPGYRVVIAGDGEERAALEAQACAAGVKNVEFTGFLTGKALSGLVRGARCVVAPSEWYETCGLVIYEAYAMGKPVIASDMGAIPEAVEEGRTGVLFPAGDAEALAVKMDSFQNGKMDIPAMGRAGRAKAEALCAGHYDRLMAVFDEVMQSNARSAPKSF